MNDTPQIQNLARCHLNLIALRAKMVTPGYQNQLGIVHDAGVNVTIAYQAYAGANNYHSNTVQDHGTALNRAVKVMFLEIIDKAIEIAKRDYDEARLARRSDLEKELKELGEIEKRLQANKDRIERAEVKS